jgi:hypothetical protein
MRKAVIRPSLDYGWSAVLAGEKNESFLEQLDA